MPLAPIQRGEGLQLPLVTSALAQDTICFLTLFAVIACKMLLCSESSSSSPVRSQNLGAGGANKSAGNATDTF